MTAFGVTKSSTIENIIDIFTCETYCNFYYVKTYEDKNANREVPDMIPFHCREMISCHFTVELSTQRDGGNLAGPIDLAVYFS